jgi:hypothetical protein
MYIKLTLGFVLTRRALLGLAMMGFASAVFAQSCDQPDIILSNQAEVNAFQNTYGPCTRVVSSLIISGGDINDLGPLSNLIEIGADLNLTDNTILFSANGLSNVTSVGASLRIQRNPILSSLALSSLQTVGADLLLTDNSLLPSVNGLSNVTSVGASLRVQRNPILSSLGLSSLQTIGADLLLTDHSLLPSVNGLSNVTSVGASLRVQRNPILSSLGLSSLQTIGADLLATDNSLLLSLDGLSNVTSVGASLRVQQNANLSSLGLSSLQTVGADLAVTDSPSLLSLDGLDSLASIGARLSVQDNAALIEVDGLNGLLQVGTDLGIRDNPRLSSCFGVLKLVDAVDDGAPGPGPGAGGVPDVGAAVNLAGNQLGCNSITEVRNGVVGALFEDFQGGTIPPGWTLIDVDGRIPSFAVDFVDDAWVAILVDPDTNNFVATSTSWYAPPGQADDWLISPAVSLGDLSVLSWRARAPDPEFADGYEVYISTTTADVAGCSGNPAVFSIAAEESAEYAVRSVNLFELAYVNQNVHVCFRNNSNDKFLLHIDDIVVRSDNLFADRFESR